MASFHINKVREMLMLTSSEQITADAMIELLFAHLTLTSTSYTLLIWNDAMIELLFAHLTLTSTSHTLY
jgi:hypothetical protein